MWVEENSRENRMENGWKTGRLRAGKVYACMCVWPNNNRKGRKTAGIVGAKKNRSKMLVDKWA